MLFFYLHGLASRTCARAVLDLQSWRDSRYALLGQRDSEGRYDRRSPAMALFHSPPFSVHAIGNEQTLFGVRLPLSASGALLELLRPLYMRCETATENSPDDLELWQSRSRHPRD